MFGCIVFSARNAYASGLPVYAQEKKPAIKRIIDYFPVDQDF